MHFVAAKEYLRSQKADLAQQELDSALAIDPNFVRAHMLMGDLLTQQKKYLLAIGHYDRAISSNPNLLEIYLKRADLHYKLKDHQRYILRDMDAAIRLAPDSAELYARKAFYLANTVDPAVMGADYAQATTAITKAIELKPIAIYYYYRSKYKFESKQLLSSLADVNKAIELDTTKASFLAYRGFIKFMMEDFRSSVGDYTRALTLDPRNSKYFESRAYGKFNLENYESAYRDYSTAIDILIARIADKKGRIHPEDPLNKELRETLLLRGMALVQDKKPYDGCDDFERAYQMGEQKAQNYIRKFCN